MLAAEVVVSAAAPAPPPAAVAPPVASEQAGSVPTAAQAAEATPGETDAAPPSSPPPKPAASRMGGVWLDPDNHRLNFDADGSFTSSRHPGRRGAWRRDGDALTLDWPDVRTTRHRVTRTASRLHLDDVAYRRADWDLSGRAFEGTWVADDGRTLRLSPDHRWDGADGAGTYRLGAARLIRTNRDGTERVAVLWTDALPHARRPDLIFLDDVRWTRATALEAP
jgi:hypothetical protein